MLSVCAHHPASGMFRGSMGRTASSFSSSSRRSPLLLQRRWNSGPFPAETLRASVLIGLHQMAGEGASGSSGSQSPDLGDTCRYGFQKGSIGTATASRGPIFARTMEMHEAWELQRAVSSCSFSLGGLYPCRSHCSFSTVFSDGQQFVH